MEAIILVGGRGTRLASVVSGLPKPMAPIAGKPFLHYLLQAMELGGFSRVILSTGYRAEAIQQHFGKSFGAIDLVYSHEDSPLGTGGAIYAALSHANDSDIFILNGDTFATVDYKTMLRTHLDRGEALSIALMPVPDTARYGAVETNENHITGFMEKGRSGPGYINAGVYLLQKNLLAGLDLPQRFSFEEEVLMKRLEELHPAAFVASGYFIDIGISEDYFRAQDELPHHLKPRR